MSILRRQRIWRGLSQKQLSDQTGIDDLDISSFERGTLKPSQDQLQCLANALQMDMASLLREFSASVAPTVSKAPELTKIKVLENRLKLEQAHVARLEKTVDNLMQEMLELRKENSKLKLGAGTPSILTSTSLKNEILQDIKRLVAAAHPDRHDNHPAATELTAELVPLLDKYR